MEDNIDLPENTIVLESPHTDAKIYIIGTAHVSEKSVNDVKKLIKMVKPNQVVLELCENRIGIIEPKKLNDLKMKIDSLKDDPMRESIIEELDLEVTDEEIQQEKNSKNSFFDNLKKGLKSKNDLITVMLGVFYQSVTKNLNVKVGDEMKYAAVEAIKNGSTIVLGDRDIKITLKRSWNSLTLWKKIKFLVYIIVSSFKDIKAEDIERLKSTDIMTELIEELGTQFPTLVEHIITERDLYLTESLRKCPGPVVVGVVGLGHLKGIQKYWKKDIDIKNLKQLPPNRSSKFRYLILASFLILLVSIIIYQFK